MKYLHGPDGEVGTTLGLYWGSIGIIEKKMEATGIIGVI